MGRVRIVIELDDRELGDDRELAGLAHQLYGLDWSPHGEPTITAARLSKYPGVPGRMDRPDLRAWLEVPVDG